MRTHNLTNPKPPDEDKWLGKWMDSSNYDLLLNETARVLKPDGSLLLVLLKRAISPEAGKAMYAAIRERISATDNRGIASGQPRIQRVLADGKKSRSNRTDKAVNSSIMGFYDRYVRFPYCRKTAFNDNYPEAMAACLPALREASALFAQHAPERYARQRAICERTHPDFMLPGTVFTTVTLNKNFRTACHRDAGDLPDGFGVMTYYRSGKFTGGHLVFPAYRVAAQFDSLDCILFDPHEIHGNTELKSLAASTPYERVTCVHYYRQNMHYCGSAEQELLLAKRHDPRQGPRSMKARPT